MPLRGGGQVSRALFEAAYELTRRAAKLAREELGVSVVPMLYIDDAFEGLDAAKIRSLLSRDCRLYTPRRTGWRRGHIQPAAWR